MSGDTADPQDGIPAPEAIAMYLYDNRQRKLSLQTQMGLQKDREALTDMILVARKAASTHLELDRPNFREQRPETLVTITDEVLKEWAQEWDAFEDLRLPVLAFDLVPEDIQQASQDPTVERQPADPMKEAKRSNSRTSTGIEQTSPGRPLASTPEASGAIPSFLYGLKFPSHDAEKIARLLKSMGVEDKEFLEILATLEMRNQWLDELREEGDLTPIQARLLKEGLDRLGRDAK
ncbi:uncharacterized protein TRAVEDRAFT_47330 [Trametes versicolor FP-101664 SS1]|uniref:uncharacterized protein n=1 Tax=Trametes versicolor (strain FP-101664) TaxID=717944 RepID=UPI000462189C|nr:uncharacterized protein TRAVEDRAFT_47330 [Trametes versicolor FP-101664 SS1]EIW58154.1 hypothetical protein TRAVEDRAFT_47330 [Trametes versicolor FP-101664 SS1]